MLTNIAYQAELFNKVLSNIDITLRLTHHENYNIQAHIPEQYVIIQYEKT